MTSNHLTLLHLSLIPGISPATLYMLLQHADTTYGGHMQEFYKFSVAQLQKIGCHEKVARAVYNGLRDISSLDREVTLLEKHGIRIVMIHDDHYPKLLKTIHVPPVILYVQGTLPLMPYVAFVGSRQANIYGTAVVDLLVPDVVGSGVAIVSGGAYGIDSMVHQAVIDAGGVTIAILGTGLLNLYPQKNKKLFEAIVETGGALVSPFALDTSPEPWRFPVRNRIIAGMSLGTVVVQAAQKSGALITASYALQEGRAVCAVPGSIEDSLSSGCHELLKQGACLVQSAQDILRECDIQIEHQVSDRAFQQVIVHKNLDNSDDTVFQASSLSEALEKKKGADVSQSAPEQPESEQDLVLRYCKKPTSTSVLSLKMSLSQIDVQAMLFQLQLDGKVEQDFAGLWQTL